MADFGSGSSLLTTEKERKKKNMEEGRELAVTIKDKEQSPEILEKCE